jgi:hypothetical protein
MLLVSAVPAFVSLSQFASSSEPILVAAGGRVQLDLEDFKSIDPPKKDGVLDATAAKIKNLYEGQARLVSELRKLEELDSRCEFMQKGMCPGRCLSIGISS